MKPLLLALVSVAFCTSANAQDIWGINAGLQNAYNMGQGYAYQRPVYYRPYYQPRYYSPRSYGYGGYGGGYGYGRMSSFDAGMLEMRIQDSAQHIEFQLQQLNNQQQLEALRMR